MIYLDCGKVQKGNLRISRKQLTALAFLDGNSQDLQKTLDYLDLNLTLNNSKITSKTFKKKHNLYLYIPFTSSHYPNCKKLLIYLLCFRYYYLNDLDKDYIDQVYKLYKRLLKRGYLLSNTKKYYRSNYLTTTN